MNQIWSGQWSQICPNVVGQTFEGKKKVDHIKVTKTELEIFRTIALILFEEPWKDLWKTEIFELKQEARHLNCSFYYLPIASCCSPGDKGVECFAIETIASLRIQLQLCP